VLRKRDKDTHITTYMNLLQPVVWLDCFLVLVLTFWPCPFAVNSARISLCFVVEKNIYELLNRLGAWGAFLYFTGANCLRWGDGRPELIFVINEYVCSVYIIKYKFIKMPCRAEKRKTLYSMGGWRQCKCCRTENGLFGVN
jgi:hypothetical protein